MLTSKEAAKLWDCTLYSYTEVLASFRSRNAWYSEAVNRLSLVMSVLKMRPQRQLMSKSTIESNGLHYPDETIFVRGIGRVSVEPSPCYFAGCVPNEPCKVEAYEKYCAEQYEPTNLDDLIY